MFGCYGQGLTEKWQCSSYVCGGYYSAFKDLLKAKKHLNVGFPIADIDYKGECVIRKEKNTGGCVTVGSVLSQLLYEIQGPLYYNSDVTANLEGVKMEQVGEDLVKVSGIKGLPPPPTTKVGITAPAGFQAEFHFLLCGLDMEEKCRWTEEQTRYAIGDNINRFSLLKFHQNGSSPIDAANQDLSTVDFRMFGQSPDPTIFDMSNPQSFYRWAIETYLQCAPGLSLSNDLRQAFTPKAYYEYWVALLPQSEVVHKTHCLFGDNKVIDIPFPPKFQEFPRQQNTYETAAPVDLSSFGPTVRAPLGYIVGGRSGDKASDCNVGFYVRHADEWDWFRSFLTVDKIKELLGPQEYKGKPIDRFEMPNVGAIHFLLHDHLDRGYNACSTYDTLGKNACEYLRAKTVDLPQKFLDRGRI